MSIKNGKICVLFSVLTIFFCASAPAAEKIIENFEGAVSASIPWPLDGSIVINSMGTTNLTHAPGSNNCFKVNFTHPGPSGTYHYKHIRIDTPIIDCRNYKELQIWAHGYWSGAWASPPPIELIVYPIEAGGGLPDDGEMFKNGEYGLNPTCIKLEGNGWYLFSIPLTQQSGPNALNDGCNEKMWFAGAFAPDRSNSGGFPQTRQFSGRLAGIIIAISTDQWSSFTIYIDDIKAVWDSTAPLEAERIENYERNDSNQNVGYKIFNQKIEYSISKRNELGQRGYDGQYRDPLTDALTPGGSSFDLALVPNYFSPPSSYSVPEGRQCLSVIYKLNAGDNKYVAWTKLLGGTEWDNTLNYRRCQDWSGYDGIRFWYFGDRSYGTVGPYENATSPLNLLEVRVDARGQYTANNDWWNPTAEQNDKFPFVTEVPLELGDYGGWDEPPAGWSYMWRQRYVPFSMLGVWGDTTNPFNSAGLPDLKAVKSLTFAIRDDKGPKQADTHGSNNGRIFMDNIELYHKTAADANKVYQGVNQSKYQYLPMTFNGRIESHTYDNALALFALTMYGNLTEAKDLFFCIINIYNYDLGGSDGSAAGQFDGFGYAYKADSYVRPMKADDAGNLGRGCGPTAYMLMALMYYKKQFGLPSWYDTMFQNIANWLANQQVTAASPRFVGDPDIGMIKWGYKYDGTARQEGSVEVNCAVYAAFKTYAVMFSDPAFDTKAEEIKTWLNTRMWDTVNNRFYAGSSATGVINTDKALDCYGLAVAALLPGWVAGDPPYANCLNNAVTDFVNTQYSLYGGVNVTGFDFGAAAGLAPDKDGVWFEGTGEMSVGFYAAGNNASGDSYVSEIEKGITEMIVPGCQGIAYATPLVYDGGLGRWRGPTAYDGWYMDVTNAHMASMCWYLFAKNKFNPFWPAPISSITYAGMEHRTTNTTAPWSHSWTATFSGGSIENTEEVRLIVRMINTGTPRMRFYYTTGPLTESAPTVVTYKDKSGDAGTSYYIEDDDGAGVVVGTDMEFSGTLKESLSHFYNQIKWKPCGSTDAANYIGTENGLEMYYNAYSERWWNVLVGGGNDTLLAAKPYPLVWNDAGGYFEYNYENNYSPLRHTPHVVSGVPSNQLCLQMKTTYYYFMPNDAKPINANFDVYGLDANKFTVNTADGFGDIIYGENPYLYVRASFGDIIALNDVMKTLGTNEPSKIMFGYGGATSATISYSTSTELTYFKRDHWGNWDVTTTNSDTIAPNNPAYTEAEKHLRGQKLHYDFLQPSDYTKIANLPEGTTVYYYFKINDYNDIPGKIWWHKLLFANGIYNDSGSVPGGADYYSYCMLQDDYTRPYIKFTATPTPDVSALRPQSVHDSGNGPWINDYIVKADLWDVHNGVNSFNPAGYANTLSGRGNSSGIYHNPDAAVLSPSANNPVHDTRVYYKISTTPPPAGLPTDKYLTSATTPNYDFIHDNAHMIYALEGDTTGYVQMTGPQRGGEWIGKIPLTESDVGKYIYYRLYVCNDDNDPQGFISASANYIVGGNPVVGEHTVGSVNSNNNHGILGTQWGAPYDTSPGGACDSDRDHGWAMYTRYGGQIVGPKVVKIRARVYIGGLIKDVVAYLNADGGKIGNIVYTGSERSQ